MLRIILALALVFVAPGNGIASFASQPNATWLVGTWSLCEDPDQSPKDSLEFHADGSGLVVRAKGNIEFVYKVSGHSVSLMANGNGYAIPIQLTATRQFDRLLFHSDRTGSTSAYVRSDSAAAAKCSVE